MNYNLKLAERGRGKFRPAFEYTTEDVKKILSKKIQEEESKYKNLKLNVDFSHLDYKMDKFNLISLFSGCGGLDLGFELGGLDAILGSDIVDEAFKNKNIFDVIRNQSIFHTIYANDIFKEATQTFKKNFQNNIYIHIEDIRKIKSFPKADIVLGGFPCPGFSEAGPRLIDDERNFLYLHFIRCLIQVKPKVFVAENVKGMMTLGKGEVFKQIVQDFEAAGYKIYHKLVNSVNYGVPQMRERVFLIGIRSDLKYEYKFPNPTHGNAQGQKPITTLRDAIIDLIDNPGPYYEGSYSTIFMSRNRKKNWNEPSFTIQASGRQAPIHPSGEPMIKIGKDKFIFSDREENNRRLSVKEIARIQTFPDWYEFSEGETKRSVNSKLDLIYKQIGNAVPVLLARAISKPIAEFAVKLINND